MSTKNIDYLLEQWALSLMKHGDLGPFENYQHLYETIDATKLGDAPWQCFQTELWPLAKMRQSGLVNLMRFGIATLRS
jgi:hypothetical protein